MAQLPPENSTAQPDSTTAIESNQVSLIRGGPFYRAQEALRLIAYNRWNLGTRITFAIAVGWVPLAIMTALFHPEALRDFLADYRVIARMLIAVPVLLLGQVLMESRFRMIVQHVQDAGLLTAKGQSDLRTILRKVTRWRDSIWPELAIVALVYATVAHAFWTHLQETRAWAITSEGGQHLLPAGWYYVLVSQLIYQFLVGLSLWKWLLWCYFLFRLSKLDLQLVATHPDGHGGVGFLGLSPMGFSPVAFAAAAAIGANWRNQILDQGRHLANFKLEAAVLLAIVLLIGIGPLFFFVPRLAKLRRQGILDYGTLGQLQSMGFQNKWVLNRKGHEEEFLAAPEISALTDYGASYVNIEKMQPFPVDKGAFVALALAMALPLLPAVLAELPLVQVFKALLDAVK